MKSTMLYLLHTCCMLVCKAACLWICKTCDCTLKQGRMPAQAKANNLTLDAVPPELSDLNLLEIRLISLRIPFMKMVALPCGKQRAIHGPAVNVPTDLHPVCELLPRLPSQAQLVPMKLKRRLCYKGHYMYEYVRPDKVMAALEWLKVNNPLYNDININRNWEDDAAQDDSELWEAVSSSAVRVNEVYSDSSQHDNTNNCVSLQGHIKDTNAGSLQDEGLVDLARESGFSVEDVPQDGNCLFSAVQCQLQLAGVECEHDTLRKQLVDFFEDHPYAHDGSTHLREFIAAPHDSTVQIGSSVDTELADAEDQYVESVEDHDTRMQLRWCRYLQRIGSTAWGDHVALQGLADLLYVDIKVLATMNPNMEPIMSCHRPTRAVLHLGLIGQFHYVSLIPTTA